MRSLSYTQEVLNEYWMKCAEVENEIICCKKEYPFFARNIAVSFPVTHYKVAELLKQQ